MDAHIVCKKVSFLYHYVFCMQITKTISLIYFGYYAQLPSIICMYIAYIGETYSLGEHRNTHVYRYNKDDPVGPARDHKTTYEQMKDATASNSTVSTDTGVRGSYYLKFL